MYRPYTAVYTGTITAAGGNTDLLYALAATGKPIRLAGWIFGQSSEVGDAMEENLRVTVQVFPATVTVGSGGSAVTPQSPDGTAAAAGFTARANDTTVATTSGTARIVRELGWNIRNTPWEHYIEEQWRPIARPAEALIIRLESTVADDLTGEFTFFVEEA